MFVQAFLRRSYTSGRMGLGNKVVQEAALLAVNQNAQIGPLRQRIDALRRRRTVGEKIARILKEAGWISTVGKYCSECASARGRGSAFAAGEDSSAGGVWKLHRYKNECLRPQAENADHDPVPVDHSANLASNLTMSWNSLWLISCKK